MMNNSLVPLRTVVLLILVIIGCLFVFGMLHWDARRPVCYGGQRWYGEWYVSYAVGKLEWRQKQYGCPKEDQYDPATAKINSLVTQ